jgi:hypothetical protein
MNALDYSQEAIPERDPAYQLAVDEGTTSPESPMTQREVQVWKRMVAIRPALACLEVRSGRKGRKAEGTEQWSGISG